MINHQFSFVKTNFERQLNELQRIRFIKHHGWQKQSPIELLQTLLNKTLVNYQTDQSKQMAWRQLLANNDYNVAELDRFPAVTTTIFYNIALQLLGFLVDQDFTIDHPIEAMTKMNLPFIESDTSSWNQDQVLKGWYLLLNTRGKNGQPYLDQLAAKGYFKQFNNLPHPLIFNGKAQAVFDTDKLIRDVVYVEAPLDTDHDGQRDLLKVSITRPRDTKDGLKVPVIFTASPYDQGTNDADGEKMTHNVDVPIKHKQPGKETIQKVQHPHDKIPAPRKIKGYQKNASESFQDKWTYTLNDYFLARGFAVAYASGIGTKGSQGLRYLGDEYETLSTNAIIEWLAGNRTAFTDHTSNIAIQAWWSNHRVGMTGRSYLGTLQIAAAASGVKGLKACIPEAAISSWYDYYRDNGLVAAPGGFQGEDADVLSEETFSRQQSAGDYWPIRDKWTQRLNAITKGQDRDSGNYNQFWANSDYLANLKKIKAAMLIVHGLNDWNVKPRNAVKFWKVLENSDAEHKIVLHQGEHIYINNFQSIDFSEIANLWMTNHLWQVHNHAKHVLPNVIVQDNLTPQTWHGYDQWNDSPQQRFYLGDNNNLVQKAVPAQPLHYSDKLSLPQLKHYTQVFNDYTQWTHDMFNGTNDLSGQQLIFKTAPLTHDQIIDGEATINLRIKSDHNVGLISAFLVDYGEAKRLTISPQILDYGNIDLGYHWRKDSLKDFTFQKQNTFFKKISEGHMNMQNRTSNDQADELVAGEFYQCQFKLQPTFYHLPAGHQIGLVICGTDLTTTIRDLTPIDYQVDISKSSFDLPLR